MTLFARLAAIAALGSAVFSTPAMAQDAPVLGTWETVMETPMGTLTGTLKLSQADGGYTVELAEQMPEGTPAMQSAISNVMVEGDTLTFDRSLTTDQGPIELKYSLAAQGNELTGKADSAFGAIPITGTRAAQ